MDSKIQNSTTPTTGEFGHIMRIENEIMTLEINTRDDDHDTSWASALIKIFGYNSIAILAFWLGSLFAVRIRKMHGSYPLLEVVGAQDAHRSMLIEFLWKLLGRRDHDGIDPHMVSVTALARSINKIKCMPVALTERLWGTYSTTAWGAHWDELLPAYTGGCLRLRGHKTLSKIYTDPFDGALVMSRSVPMAFSPAMMQRTISIEISPLYLSADANDCRVVLRSMPIDCLSGWLLRALNSEATIIDTIRDTTPIYESQLMLGEGVAAAAIAKNYAQIMALVDALALITPLNNGDINYVHQALWAMARRRLEAVSSHNQKQAV